MKKRRRKIYLPKELEARMKKVAKQVKALRDVQCNESYAIKKIAKVLGYKYIGKGAGDGAYAKDGIVIKKMYRSGTCPLFCRVPTIVVKRGLGDCDFCVQPLCDLTGRETAFNMLQSVFHRGGWYIDDFRLPNVGWFNGQPVMFDW